MEEGVIEEVLQDVAGLEHSCDIADSTVLAVYSIKKLWPLSIVCIKEVDA